MTDQGWMELGQRAMACRGWHWMRGMSTYCGLVAQSNEDATGRVYFGGWVDPHPHWIPDFRDPATVGCLLALVRRAYPNNDLCVQFLHTYQTASSEVEFAVYEVHDQRYIPQLSRTNGGHPTEAHALVAALEAAP
jgi:hypothetical protein